MQTETQEQQEILLVERARHGDGDAFGELVEPLRKPLFSYIYRMVTLRQDAEDLLQDVLVRVLKGLPGFRGDARFKTWLFGIATHVCLDHLRSKKRWRVEAQLYAQRETEAYESEVAKLEALIHAPDFVFEMREHIAFCFSCISRTLKPDEQALVQIEVAPGIEVTPESLFDARLKIVRETGFPESKTRPMHDMFFEGLNRREKSAV